MIILDQDLFFIEDVLIISLKLRPLTTSDEDGLRIGLVGFLSSSESCLRMTCAPKLGMSERRTLFR